jgi:hypothetical protein
MTAARRVAPGIFATAPAIAAPAPIVLRLEGRLVLEPGREVTVRGIGRCAYHGRTNADGSLDVFDAAGRCRSVMPERVTKVHRTTKLRKDG